MKKSAIYISLILIVINALAFSPIAEAKSKSKGKAKGKEKKEVKVEEFGFNSVQQLNASIYDINLAENFVLIRQGKGANKKVLTTGAVIVKVTESGPQAATLTDLIKGENAYMWVKKKLGPNKAYQGLIITQFLGNKVLSSQPPVAQFALSASQGLENAAPLLAVSLSKATDKDVRISYTVSGTATGSSTDYTLANGDLVITAGQTTGIVPLSITSDSAQETDETVVVTLAAAINATLGTQKVHTYTIKDDDQSQVGFSTTAESGAESVAAVNIPVILNTAAQQEVRVDYTVSGTALGAGTDYTLANGTAVIAAGQTSTNITAAVVDDSAMEAGETIIVTLSNPTGAALSSNTVYTYTITDNDKPTIGFSLASSAGAESTTTVTIPVVLSAASSSATSVNYAVTGTATGNGNDYALANGTVTIPSGQTTANIALTVVNDTTDELDETVILTLSGPVEATLGSTAVHTYTIQDNDNPTVQFSTATASGGENVTPVSVGLTLSAAPAAEVQVAYTVTGTATGGGTDYTLANGTATFAVGQTTANLSLAVVDDAVADVGETVIITLSNPTNSSLGATPIYTYTINDND